MVVVLLDEALPNVDLLEDYLGIAVSICSRPSKVSRE